MLVNERWLSFLTEERIRDIQQAEAHHRLVQQARGQQARRAFHFALPRIKFPTMQRTHQRPARLAHSTSRMGGA